MHSMQSKSNESISSVFELDFVIQLFRFALGCSFTVHYAVFERMKDLTVVDDIGLTCHPFSKIGSTSVNRLTLSFTAPAPYYAIRHTTVTRPDITSSIQFQTDIDCRRLGDIMMADVSKAGGGVQPLEA